MDLVYYSYRKAMGLDAGLGVAVIVQAMVYGNSSRRSGSGICFSRNPITGEHKLFGDFAFDSEGEEVLDHKPGTISLVEVIW